MKKRVRVLVTGAAGHIGYALLFRIASGQMFGPDVDVELNLLELPNALEKLHGVAMELDDCAFPLLKRILCTDSLKSAMDGVNWALLVGAVPRKQGMERADLLKINGAIFKDQGNALNEYASEDVRVFVVGNPCNTNCYITQNFAPSIPKDRFYAMTTLDELRARALLAHKSGRDVTEISKMTIWGNHSATQFPDFYNARIDGLPVTDIIHDEQWLQNDFVQKVQLRGAEIIKALGSSSAASAANAIVTGVHNLVTDTVANETFSMALSSQGQYGVDEGLIFSFPCVREHGFIRRLGMEEGVVRVVEDFEFNEWGKQKFDVTLNELRQEREDLKALGLVG